MDDNLKFQQMQDEMSRFEAEISGERILAAPASAPARPVIGVNTYNNVQQQLEQGTFPPPPPPPLLGGGFPPPMGMMFGAIPPPPPPSSMLVPPQVRARVAPPPAPFPLLPGGYLMPPHVVPPKPQPAVLSSAPQLYRNKPEKKSKKEHSKQASLEPTPAPRISEPPAAPAPVASQPPAIPIPAPAPAPLPTPIPAQEAPQHHSQHKSSKKEKKIKKAIRTAGGQVWEDPTLLEWGDDDFRLFCGDLGNDVTDELLIRTFSKYSSFSKAKVIRDKRTNKSKGFGFISFKEPADFIKAMKEMNGRYVGSRPIKLRKSTWKARSLDVVRKKEKEKAALISLLTGGPSKP